MSQQSDIDDLLLPLKEGLPGAFASLVERRKDRIYSICFHYLKDSHDADDATQDVFMKVHQSVSGFREDATLDTWLYRIAVTTSLDHLRRRKRKTPWKFTFSVGSEAARTEEKAEDRPAWDQVELFHPGLALEEKERAQALYAAIDSLPENQRTAVILHYIQGLKYQEISEIMATSFSSVESLLFRARKNLEKMLSKSLGGKPLEEHP